MAAKKTLAKYLRESNALEAGNLLHCEAGRRQIDAMNI
jgi:hypothetical protein